MGDGSPTATDASKGTPSIAKKPPDARKKQKSVPYGISGSLVKKKKLTFLKFPDFRLVKLCFYCYKPFSLCHFNMPIQIVTCNTDIISLFSDLNEINLKIIKKRRCLKEKY